MQASDLLLVFLTYESVEEEAMEGHKADEELLMDANQAKWLSFRIYAIWRELIFMESACRK